MIDHLLGRPSTSLKRLQVLAVLLGWSIVLKKAPRDGPKRWKWLYWANRRLSHFSPWKIILATMMLLYSIRHIETWLDHDTTCITWDAPQMDEAEFPF